MNDIFVNGPIFVVRLEGYVNKVKKVLYLFGDNHSHDSQCDDVDSIDVSKYIPKVLKEASQDNSTKNIVYDIFVETNPFTYDSGTRTSENHLRSMRKVYRSILNVNNGNVVNNPNYQNIRVQYTDFRDIVRRNSSSQKPFLATDLDIVANSSSNIYNRSKEVSKSNEKLLLNKIIPLYEEFHKILINKNITSTNRENFNKIGTISSDEILRGNAIPGDNNGIQSKMLMDNILNKIKHKFNNESIKLLLLDELNNTCLIVDEIIKKLITSSKICNSITDFISNGTHSSVDTSLQLYDLNYSFMRIMVEIDYLNLDFGVALIDTYMLRRFLDKDYITNAIYYCGNDHLQNITYLLVKSFNFKITHFSISNNLTITDINTNIQNSSYSFIADRINFMDKLFEFKRPITYEVPLQCSNMKNFPRLFT